jgi:ectoine hydroxylase-related dioxygenase (phytanoyl-CoA dioxygenase family)
LDQALLEMEVYGFTLLEDVLNPEEVSCLKESLLRCYERTGREQNFMGTAGHVSNLPTHDQNFFYLLDHPKTLPILEAILGQNLILGSLNARIVRPDDFEQGFHTDIGAELLNPLSPVMCNTVWMLDDFSPMNGSTRIVPGSHKSGMVGPPEGFLVQHVFQVTARAGSVLVFNGQCWHAGGNNQSNVDRHALFGHYRKSSLIFQVDPHDGFPVEWYDLLSPRQRELLRMEHGLGVPHAADAHLRHSFARGKLKPN